MSTLSMLIADPAFEVAFRVREPVAQRASSLLVLLHGVGGNETNLAALATEVPADTLVVLPRGRLELGPGQYAWFRVAFTGSGPQIVASEAEDSRLALIRFVGQLQDAHGIAPGRTAIAGFSQGGILSASVALTAPERVSGFAVLAGRILPELEPALASPQQLHQLRGLIAHGLDDTKLPVTWAQRADAWLEQLGVPHATRLYPGDHGISEQMARDFLDWQQELLSPPTRSIAQLVLGGENCLLVGARADQEVMRIAPGVDPLLRKYFPPGAPHALAMENAIAAIEDELAKAPASVHGIAIASNDPNVRAIARAAGAGSAATSIDRDAVEQVFARQSAVALGRPAPFEALPEDTSFVAALLLVRELMHHLDIASIHIDEREPVAKVDPGSPRGR